ncbi:MAG TPA: magnesium transporter [Verrucomicrobiae bacterium]|nr:magnesium transporter [Verrucomicrobiae bacterium]
MATHSLNAADELLDLWPTLRRSKQVDLFESLPRDLMDNFFLALDARAQSRLLLAIPEGERRLYIRLLAPDDAADLIQESPKSQRQYLLDLLDDKTVQEVRALLAFREDIAGGLMNPRFARLRPDASINEAISYLRQQLPHVETIHYAYVLDENQALLGVISLKDLVAADPHKTVRDVMITKLYTVTPKTDQAEIAHLLTKHGIKAVPVVDENRHMQGIVTAKDLIDVIQEEDTEDMQKLGGMEALDGPYLETSFLAMIKKRAGWLVILFLGEMLTATAMGHFEYEIERAVVLSLFIPLLISSGGNSGSQATSLIIRALALKEVRLKDWWRVISREVFAGIALGAILGIVGMIRILIWQSIWHTYGEHYLLVALTIACSLLGVVTFGTLAGSMLPFILRKCGLDPASASAPFVATLVDVTGLVIYFTVAKIILTGTLL